MSLTVELADGTVGYTVRRVDDCLAAAIATTLQVPIEEVPDPHVRERIRGGEDPAEINDQSAQVLKSWLADHGLRMVVHRRVPAARRRWIGIVPHSWWFHSHCMVMRFGEILFDPSETYLFHFDALPALISRESASRLQAAMRVRRWGPERVGFGLSFQEWRS